VPVGDEIIALILVLELPPVVEGAHEVAEMEQPAGLHAAENAFFLGHEENLYTRE
jgi:hypothetical protein